MAQKAAFGDSAAGILGSFPPHDVNPRQPLTIVVDGLGEAVLEYGVELCRLDGCCLDGDAAGEAALPLRKVDASCPAVLAALRLATCTLRTFTSASSAAMRASPSARVCWRPSTLA